MCITWLPDRPTPLRGWMSIYISGPLPSGKHHTLQPTSTSSRDIYCIYLNSHHHRHTVRFIKKRLNISIFILKYLLFIIIFIFIKYISYIYTIISHSLKFRRNLSITKIFHTRPRWVWSVCHSPWKPPPPHCVANINSSILQACLDSTPSTILLPLCTIIRLWL